jgi:GNAT superfamily N-acetyltransferase
MPLPLRQQSASAQSAIRTAVTGDAHRLAACRIKFYQTQIAAGWLDLPSDLNEWVNQSTMGIISGSRNCVLLAEHGAALTGYVFATTKILPNVQKPRVVSIEEIYVDPQHRWSGLARRLFEKALTECKSRGADRIQLRILAGNTAGRTFWNSLGFRENVVICELDQPQHDQPIS